MKMMTTMELENKQEKELAALFGLMSQTLAMTERETSERSAALGNLENISRARATRFMKWGR